MYTIRSQENLTITEFRHIFAILLPYFALFLPYLNIAKFTNPRQQNLNNFLWNYKFNIPCGIPQCSFLRVYSSKLSIKPLRDLSLRASVVVDLVGRYIICNRHEAFNEELFDLLSLFFYFLWLILYLTNV